MARYIDADLLIKKIFPLGMIDDGNFPINAKAVKVAIDKLSTVVEVKYGQWKKHRDDGDCEYIECSVCRQEFYPPNNEFEFDYYPKYCQECGAKMDRKEVD